LTALGIAAKAVKIMKVCAWASPGTSANAGQPVVQLDMQDLLTAASLGKKRDTGLLSRNAALAFSYSQQQRDFSLALGTARTVCEAEITNSPAGTMNISLMYIN
jgi:hypothetical protein